MGLIDAAVDTREADITGRQSWLRRFPSWCFPIAAFAAAWTVIVTTWAVADATGFATVAFRKNFTDWDGAHYLAVAMHGYPPGTPEVAFFPALPALERVLHYLTFGHWLAAVIIVQWITGAAAAHAIWVCTRHRFGQIAANRTVVVWLLLPGCPLLAWGYTEPLAVALAAWCLHLLGRGRWVLAGLVAAAAGTVRLDMLALAVACGVAALVAVWRHRDWRALFAPVLAPVGAGAYVLWMGHRRHDLHFLTHVEQKYWGMRFDAGKTMWHQLFGGSPLAWHYGHFLWLGWIVFAALIVGLVLAAWRRVPLPWLVYAVTVAAISLGTTLPTVRYTIKAFPVAAGYAALPRRVFAVLVAPLAAIFVASALWWSATRLGQPAP